MSGMGSLVTAFQQGYDWVDKNERQKKDDAFTDKTRIHQEKEWQKEDDYEAERKALQAKYFPKDKKDDAAPARKTAAELAVEQGAPPPPGGAVGAVAAPDVATRALDGAAPAAVPLPVADTGAAVTMPPPAPLPPPGAEQGRGFVNPTREGILSAEDAKLDAQQRATAAAGRVPENPLGMAYNNMNLDATAGNRNAQDWANNLRGANQQAMNGNSMAGGGRGMVNPEAAKPEAGPAMQPGTSVAGAGRGSVNPAAATPAPTAVAAAGQDPDIAGVRWTESRGNKNAVGPLIPGQGRAQGDMQVMSATSANPGFGVAPAKDNSPAELTRVGEQYFTALRDHYKDPAIAAVAYNWGPGNTDKWLAKGGDFSKLPPETQKYVGSVLTTSAVTRRTGGAPASVPTGAQMAQDGAFVNVAAQGPSPVAGAQLATDGVELPVQTKPTAADPHRNLTNTLQYLTDSVLLDVKHGKKGGEAAITALKAVDAMKKEGMNEAIALMDRGDFQGAQDKFNASGDSQGWTVISAKQGTYVSPEGTKWPTNIVTVKNEDGTTRVINTKQDLHLMMGLEKQATLAMEGKKADATLEEAKAKRIDAQAWREENAADRKDRTDIMRKAEERADREAKAKQSTLKLPEPVQLQLKDINRRQEIYETQRAKALTDPGADTKAIDKALAELSIQAQNIVEPYIQKTPRPEPGKPGAAPATTPAAVATAKGTGTGAAPAAPAKDPLADKKAWIKEKLMGTFDGPGKYAEISKSHPDAGVRAAAAALDAEYQANIKANQ